MKFSVTIVPQAQKDFRKIPKTDQAKIRRKISTLETSPFYGKKLEGELASLYTLRAWPYRIIYQVFKKNEVYVVHILHRQGAYR